MENIQPKKRSGILGFVSLLIILILIVAVGYLWYKNKMLTNTLPADTGTATTEAEVKMVTEGLAKIMLLPKEVPQVARVLDPEQLKSVNPFFADVLKDDYLVLFPPNKALIFRPSTNMIINFDLFSVPEQPKTKVEAPKATSTKK